MSVEGTALTHTCVWVKPAPTKQKSHRHPTRVAGGNVREGRCPRSPKIQ